MAKTSRPGGTPGHARIGRPRVLKDPVSVRLDIERCSRDTALQMMVGMGHESLAETLRCALNFYINHHATKDN